MMEAVHFDWGQVYPGQQVTINNKVFTVANATEENLVLEEVVNHTSPSKLDGLYQEQAQRQRESVACIRLLYELEGQMGDDKDSKLLEEAKLLLALIESHSDTGRTLAEALGKESWYGLSKKQHVIPAMQCGFHLNGICVTYGSGLQAVPARTILHRSGQYCAMFTVPCGIVALFVAVNRTHVYLLYDEDGARCLLSLTMEGVVLRRKVLDVHLESLGFSQRQQLVGWDGLSLHLFDELDEFEVVDSVQVYASSRGLVHVEYKECEIEIIAALHVEEHSKKYSYELELKACDYPTPLDYPLRVCPDVENNPQHIEHVADLRDENGNFLDEVLILYKTVDGQRIQVASRAVPEVECIVSYGRILWALLKTRDRQFVCQIPIWDFLKPIGLPLWQDRTLLD